MTSLAMPVLVLLSLALIAPLVVLLRQSLTGEGGQLTLANYAALVTSLAYRRALLNSVLIAVSSTALALALCLPVAIYIERSVSRYRNALAVALTIPLSLPGIVIGFFVILLFGLTGIVPQIFLLITGERQFNFAYTFWGMLLGYLYFQIPRAVLVLRGAVSALSQDVIDVSRTLGATPWRVYLDVILPALSPALLSAASVSLATAFGAFGTAATLSRGFRVLPLEIASLFTESFQVERAAGLSIALTCLTVAVLFGLGRAGERAQR
ncbi:MAG: ABC transporter permease [Candidatus Roseilinea sp.]|nr:MAG: ABC transporter permease [Candidatus Roseilinea sp.]